MPEEAADPAITTEYRGQTVAFCCDICWKKFSADPERYVARLPRLAGSGEAAGIGEEIPRAGGSGQAMGVDAEPGSERRPPLPGRLHPLVVHFPLAGIPVALLGFLIWGGTGRESFARADVPALFVGALGAIAAWLTGDIARESTRFSEAMDIVAGRHEFVSTVTLVLVLCIAAVRIWRWNRMRGAWRWLYGLGLAVCTVLLAITGYLGGTLVFGPGHLDW